MSAGKAITHGSVAYLLTGRLERAQDHLTWQGQLGAILPSVAEEDHLLFEPRITTRV